MAKIYVNGMQLESVLKTAEEVLEEGGCITTEGLSFEDGIIAAIGYMLGDEGNPYQERLEIKENESR